MSRKTLRETLQRHRLAGAGRSGDQSMPVGLFQQQVLVFAIAAKPEENTAHL